MTSTSVGGLTIKAAPAPLFPDHPDACFVLHTPSNRRMPATWATPQAAQKFVEAVQDMADWPNANATLTQTIVQAIDDHDGSWDDFGTPRLPTPPYVPSPAEIANLLDKALAVLTTNGWCQGDASTFHDIDQEHDEDLDPSQCRVCARGAINIAAEGDPRPPTAYELSVLADAATATLAETLSVDDVTVWNDAEGRTSDQLHTAITRTIARLRDAR
ncbi:DUF6197 family protein [Streptomyces javensis]|uniref:Uncharacterized protein n=1 Tax=Streptomyces javensis TaxID=114698 RepID=A0ABS0R5R5_9ACTN|nr:hypothetical protein [Streptomyces javensis]MBI0312717.1 hypothetical protein [Streptomyces javensis]